MDSRMTVPIKNIKRQLRDFSVNCSGAPDLVCEHGIDRNSIDRSLFPVPNMILYVLHELCSFPLGCRSEKIHWSVLFTYRGVDCAISSEKFGASLYIAKNSAVNINKNELLEILKRAVEIAEKSILSRIAKEQMEIGNITVDNQFLRLGNQYAYFREKAETAYSSLDQECNDGKFDSIFNLLNRKFKANNEGMYNALAMLDAYFSRLEHFLLLALPFSSFNRNTDDLIGFAGKIWSEKMKMLVDVKSAPAQDYYNRLFSLKWKYRNTFEYGGVEKRGMSFCFHLPNYGAIPASMSSYRDSVHFNIFAIESVIEGILIKHPT